jgi:transposase InsO family protein
MQNGKSLNPCCLKYYPRRNKPVLPTGQAASLYQQIGQLKNVVWSTDITYIRLPGRFVYLVAIIDRFSRDVLAWHLSNTMDVHFCLVALEQALQLGQPQIFNSDQGSQFISEAFTRNEPKQDSILKFD